MNIARWKLYGAIAAAAVAIIIAIAGAINAWESRIRREGEFQAEKRVLIARADTVLRLARDSAAARTARDSTEKEALKSSLRASNALAVALREDATEARRRADSAEALIAVASTADEKLAAAMTAVAERGREAMQWRAVADQERSSREIVERAIVQRDSTIARLEREAAEHLDLIQDLRDQLADPLAAPAKRGFFTKALAIGEHIALIVVTIVAIAK